MSEQGSGPLRFGIVGCGVIGKTHAAAISSLADAELAGVADVLPERARVLANRHGTSAYPDLSTMLAALDLDVITICTASGLHGEQAEEAMRAGKHVIVEKPLEITLPAIDHLLDVQRAAGVKLAVISQHRYDPAARRVHELIANGAFGTLVLANAHILWWRSQEYYDSGEWRGTWALDGGGVLMNQSIHSIDLLQWFMGPVKSIYAYTDTLAHRMETEDVAVAVLRFANGALGTIAATTAAYPGMGTRVEILGEKGSAIIEDDMLAYLHLARDDREEAVSSGATSGPRKQESNADSIAQERAARSLRSHVLQTADMIRAIREDGTPLVDGQAGRQPVEVILGIYESVRNKKEVLFP